MPFQGFTRLRKFQAGRQTSHGSNIGAKRIYPWRGPITVAPNRTQPDVDMGSLDPILASYNGPENVAQSPAGTLAFDDSPFLWAGLFGANVTPTGTTAKSWIWQAASLSADAFDEFTGEYGDDVSTDVVIAGGGIIDTIDVGFADDLGAWTVSAGMVYSRAQLGTNGFTGGLVIDDTPNWVYGADTEVFIDTAAGSIGTTKLTDDVHAARFTVNANNDQKRFANGSNTRFQLAGFGRGAREGHVIITRAKTTSAVLERQTLDDEPVPTRFIELRTTSPEIITGSTPYSQSIRVPAELQTVEDGEIGGNSVLIFDYHVKYNATLGYAYRVAVVNTLASTGI